MKTRKELIKFLRDQDGIAYANKYECIADKLIEAGFVQLREPRTFWIVKRNEISFTGFTATDIESDAKEIWNNEKDREIIKVIEVLE